METLVPDPVLELQLEAEVFRALGDPSRLRILACLSAHGQAAAVQVVARCLEIDYSVVARHLKVLERAGLLSVIRCGRTTCYALRREAVVARFRDLAEAFANPASACAPGDCGDDDPAGACCDTSAEADPADSAPDSDLDAGAAKPGADPTPDRPSAGDGRD